jgi:hypothetical protein
LHYDVPVRHIPIVLRRTLLGCISICLVFAVAGCAESDLASPEADVAAKLRTSPTSQMARLYIYRNRTFIGGGVVYPALLDSQIVAQVAVGTYAMLELRPGDYVMSSVSVSHGNELELHLNPGEACFLEQKAGPLGGIYYERVENGVGFRNIQVLKRVKARYKQ